MNRLILAMMTTLVLAGCGQTGPLYMPDDQQSRDRYDPQGDYQQDDSQQGDTSQDDASQRSAPQSDDARGERSVSVPEGDSSPATTTAGTIGGAASTGAPAAPAAVGQGGT
ncbi:LPS translocon maturation chaperone LptM [Kushneria phyllosphaerae]|uniref:Lipopeptide n=1 Tax=Kushneria phyllosphaerae TaxID=2100822 RepID=A0A2R8CIK7_9GAMM|nr:Lipopeptide [Kushneria phyllosphaerae]